eukprot:4058388-Prymnesium_polylepis.1
MLQAHQFSAALGGPRLVFLCTGEGSHNAGADLALLHGSPAWATVEAAVSEVAGVSRLEDFFAANLGVHTAPSSPVVSVS